MFTGLIEEIGIIKNIRNSGDGKIFEVSAETVLVGTKIGDSISINGACQTVTSITNTSFDVFASKITCSITTLGLFKQGDSVNLERAMSHDSRFGGHIVQGHVDCRGEVLKINRDPQGCEILIKIDSVFSKYIVNKGSISVDGISLTVVSVDDEFFTIYLIPETLSNTIINNWTSGSQVNIEVDILAKYVERFVSVSGKNEADKSDEKLMEKLIEGGYA